MDSPIPYAPNSAAYPSTLARIDVHRVFYLLRSRWPILTAALVVFLGLAGWIILRSPITYSARAVVQVEQALAKVIVIEEVSSEDFKSLEVLRTVEHSLTSRSLFLRVIQAEKLAENPAFAPPKKDGSKHTEAELIDSLTLLVEAKLRRGTRLIDITVAPGPEHAIGADARKAVALPAAFDTKRHPVIDDRKILGAGRGRRSKVYPYFASQRAAVGRGRAGAAAGATVTWRGAQPWLRREPCAGRR